MTKQFNSKTGARGIEWCDETRNIFGGCFHRCRWQMPDGTVAMCYAESLAENGVAKAGYPAGFEHHYFREDGFKALVAGRNPEFIFMDSMSDLFGHWVDEANVRQVMQAMGTAPQHAYQSLTKAPKRILKFMNDLPANLWVGVSSPPDFFMPETAVPHPAFKGTGMKPSRPMDLNQKVRYMASTMDVLRQVKAHGNLTWMSLEPVSWDMAAYIGPDHPLDWAIIGAASNGRAYFQPEASHIQKLLDIFDATNTPVFFKGNIRPLITKMGGRWREDFPATYRDGSPIPAVLRRQEMAHEHGWTPNAFLDTAVPGWAKVKAVTAVPAQMSFFVW